VNLNDIAEWSERNRRWLLTRLAYWRECIEAMVAEAAAVPGSPPDEPAVDGFKPAALRLAAMFGLSTFETELLVLSAGVEVDALLREAVARAQGLAAGRPVQLDFSLALKLLPQAHWDAISPLAPLRAWSLVECDASLGLAQAALRIDERILHAITGVAAFEQRLVGIARLADPAPDSADSPAAAAIARAVVEQPSALVVLADARLDAERRRGARALAGAALRRARLGALWVDAAALNGDARELAEIARRLEREALLAQAGVVLSLSEEAAHTGAALRLLALLSGPAIVLGAPSPLQLADIRRPVLRFAVPRVQTAPRADLPPRVRAAAQRALQQFRVEPALLEQALQSVPDGDDAAATEGALWQALREAARGGLDALAQRIDSRTTFDDLVVPPFVAAQLREITAQLRHRQTVYHDWGLGQGQTRGLGLAVLFAGESGTGKTTAAEAIANAAGLDLYRIDLSSVVSKYIGETEKNLARLFDAAEASGAILLFDEADALFGKRSDVKDSHDRYANIEVAYLLQRIESYRGLAILTTNMKGALDRAFLRRLRFIVQFPFPDAAAREQIWQRQFAQGAPLGQVDFAALARLQLTGGSIRSVALHAAFRAADAERKIDQQLLIEAAQVEHAKLERTMNGSLRGGLQWP
jgi:tetratricopeptide (TPR) repeat protein